MSQFPEPHQLASWADCVRGIRKVPANGSVDRPVKATGICGASWCKMPGGGAHGRLCFDSTVLRVAAHQGIKKAAVAVAHRILMLAYYIIRDGTEYQEAGGDYYYDRRNPSKTAKRLTRRLERLGFEVTVKPRKEKTPKPRTGPLPGQTCKRCNAWGIACIHVRPGPAVAPEGLSHCSPPAVGCFEGRKDRLRSGSHHYLAARLVAASARSPASNGMAAGWN
jgi:hypothetical protein